MTAPSVSRRRLEPFREEGDLALEGEDPFRDAIAGSAACS